MLLLKQSQKTKFEPENKWFKSSYMEFIYQFQIFWQKVSKPTKQVKKNTHFTTQFCSKNLTHFKNLSSINIIKNILPQTAKNLTSFTNFPGNMFLVIARKNICIVPFLDFQSKNCSLEALGNQMSAYSCKCP